MAGKPAARIGDPTCHGGTLVGPGVPTILIGGMPASTMGDTHVCPMCTPAPVPIPHVGGPVILGSTGVMLGKKPAARMGDMAVCVGPPSSIIMGCPTVLIGEVGSGSQGSGAGAASPAEVSPPGTGTATALALAAATSTTGQSHAIDLEFVDAAGRPLAGVPFHLTDPQGNVTLAASDPQGNWTRSGLAQAGSYTVEVRLLRNARCDQTKIQSGTACRFSCEAPGFPDGTPAVIRLQVLDTDHKARTIETLRTEVKAEKIEVPWTLEPQALAQASHQQAGQAALESLDAVFTAGVQCLVGKPIPLELKVVPLELPTGKLGAAHFRTDGCVPLLDEKNALIELLADILDYGENAKERGETAVLFGNSSSSGSPEHNRELSLWRGKMVKALLDHDEIAWRNTACTHAKPEDARQILSSLHKAHGWECDPESESTKTHGIQEFQQEANSRFALDLTEDGILGPWTWTAIHRVLCALIQDELGYDPDQEPDWPLLAWGFGEGAGVYPNGSDHATGGNKESERNVEVSFFPKGCVPKLKLPKNGKKGTFKENPREDGKRFEKGDSIHAQNEPIHTLPLHEEHFHNDHFLPTFQDDTFMLVVADLTQKHKSRTHFKIRIHPEAPSSNHRALKKRKLLMNCIIRNNSSSWASFINQVTTSDVQSFLSYFSRLGFPCHPGEVDGISGPRTRNAIQEFQRIYSVTYNRQISIDGIFGIQTWNAFFETIKKIAASIS